jgi:hypothetical protein
VRAPTVTPWGHYHAPRPLLRVVAGSCWMVSPFECHHTRMEASMAEATNFLRDASTAATVKESLVLAVSPLMVVLVPARLEATEVPLRKSMKARFIKIPHGPPRFKTHLY